MVDTDNQPSNDDLEKTKIGIVDIPPKIDWLVYINDMASAVLGAACTAYFAGGSRKMIIVSAIWAFLGHARGWSRDSKSRYKYTRFYDQTMPKWTDRGKDNKPDE